MDHFYHPSSRNVWSVFEVKRSMVKQKRREALRTRNEMPGKQKAASLAGAAPKKS